MIKTIAFSASLIIFTPIAHATVILSSASNGSQAAASETAGSTVSVDTAGVGSAKALSLLGVNKVYANAQTPIAVGEKRYATSFWGENFTFTNASGTGNVDATFTIRIDGNNAASGNLSETRVNYGLIAYKGRIDDFGGVYAGDTAADFDFAAVQNQNGGKIYRDTDSVSYVGPSPANASIRLDTRFQSDENGIVTGRITVFLASTGQFLSNTRYFSDYAIVRGQYGPNGSYGADTVVAYNSGAFGSQLQTQYLNSQQSLPIAAKIGCGQLGGEGSCPVGLYPGADLTLSFSVPNGTQVALIGGMIIESLDLGLVDFFNTATLTQVVLSPDAQLESDSGQFVQQQGSSSGGQVVFRFIPASVPEPASFALFAMGLAGLAVATRRRDPAVRQSPTAHLSGLPKGLPGCGWSVPVF
jgi:PEP-CTERM motif